MGHGSPTTQLFWRLRLVLLTLRLPLLYGASNIVQLIMALVQSIWMQNRIVPVLTAKAYLMINGRSRLVDVSKGTSLELIQSPWSCAAFHYSLVCWGSMVGYPRRVLSYMWDWGIQKYWLALRRCCGFLWPSRRGCHHCVSKLRDQTRRALDLYWNWDSELELE